MGPQAAPNPGPARPALFEAHEARVAVDGVVAVDRLSLVTAGDRVVLAGDAGALLAAITGAPRVAGGGARVAVGGMDGAALPGEASVVAGTLLLAGKSVAEGAHVRSMGAAPLDPPLPPRWTAEAYVTWSARLGGASRGEARALAAAALARVGLASARRKAAGALSPSERRALGLAQAIVLGPEVLVAEAPLSGLEGDPATFVRDALAAAAEGRRALLSAARIDAGSPEGALAQTASHVVVLVGGEVAAEGPPGEVFGAARTYALTVRSNAEPLRAALAARGISLSGGPLRFSAALPAGAGTGEILEAARAARAAVVEMVPMMG